MKRLVVADDHPFLRAGVEAVLRGSEFEIAAFAGNGEEALAAIAREDPDIVVLDLSMPRMGGIEVLEDLRARGDRRRVVLLAAHVGDLDLLAAMKNQVDGIVLKEGAENALIDALRQVAVGRRALSPHLRERASALAKDGPRAGPMERLTPAERRVAEAVALGLRNREIAARLGNSEGTVRVVLHGIYQKLGVDNRTELAIMITRQADGL